ncbi:hypothetical protein DICSQDRAFT_182370 [Dichomitus squalens LYAD-421 SS1]|uniref:Integral membrane protein n=1 Tax=Dichomitus squalens (strain LYAD-421) TaxID=732165 RepID=R7SUS6_DICSQ|nr:uncharacterized protein DICSQDRAFT_182370 [Dichomitus squalens LYAD-421 SS1]EJF58697.1 hypothetical protein DICSQDRAFT_182370 [Dichomitus squalens LYAD-421 SS1]
MALPMFPIDESYLIAGWLESFLWGLFTLIYGMSIFSVYKRRRNGINKFTTLTISVLYILATAHMSLALVRLIQGFILYRDTIGPVMYFANISVRLNMAKDYIYITSLGVGDLVVVWRLYTVWGKNLWAVLVPGLLIIGEFIAGYGSISQWFLPHPVPETMVKWGTAMFVMSMSTNIIVTAAIGGRIWWVTRRNRTAIGVYHQNRYTRIILLIVESGAVIAAAKLIEFTLFQLAPVDGLTGLNAMYIVYESIPQITGLAPTCIVYAVNSGFTRQDDYYVTNQKSTIAFRAPSAVATTNSTAFDGSNASTLALSSLEGGNGQHLKRGGSSGGSLEKMEFRCDYPTSGEKLAAAV